MLDIPSLRALGLFDARVPRYTSYPPATAFAPFADESFQRDCLAALDPARPVSVYVHVPFCERLCWFCACQTQGTTTLNPVLAYLDTVEAELALLCEALPAGIRMARMHWGGGTPTILPPALIRRLAGAIGDVIPPTPDCEFSVEIDPTMVDEAKIAALAEIGLSRASLGIQDFDPQVQRAIGRLQSFEQTRDCVRALRRHGVASLNADLVYGLPHQTPERFAATVGQVLELAPDRVALFGYAHVPHHSRRQKLIPGDALPSGEERHALACLATSRFEAAGLDAIGIDHFALADDALAVAARTGRLRRNFQGYTDDTCPELIGIGASSISGFPGGIVQNAAMTPAYAERIAAGRLAGARGHRHMPEDRLRARAIEMLMCDFRLDMRELERDFGPRTATLEAGIDAALARFGPAVTRELGGLSIRPEGRTLTRLIAALFDARVVAGARYSQAS
ncbi:oxygen-independent coproporphyrinogen III oxidase [Jannaschia aquimarina]|nr:oxygen-independent coproporphyrinogen III oxidase [Jannaschia aquimarina]